MLSLHVVTPHQGRHYYKEENYYSHGQATSNSNWSGFGAKNLGLSGGVKPEDFERLLFGQHPFQDLPITGSHQGHEASKRSGIDLTFSAPKSVSLAALIGGDLRLEAAHKEAVEKALAVAESRYSLARAGSGKGRQDVAFGNLVIAQFHHDTSRAKDPQLHTHAVVLNAVKRDDGQWRGLRNEGFFRNSKLLGLIYQNELAIRVQELGYQITPNAKGTFEINGYTEEQLRTFSKRRVQLEDLGVTNQKEARTLVKVNRPTKGPEVSREKLLVGWHEEALGYGIMHPTFEKKRDLQLKDPGEVVEKAMAHAGERDVRFRREDMERFALENHLGKVVWRGLQGAIDGEKGVSLLPTIDQKWTTRQALMTEYKILEHLEQGKGTFNPLLNEFPRSLEDKGLTEGQKAALKSAFLSKDQFTAWQGVAGAGKTFALRELGLESEKKGHKIFGFAPSAEAAKVLESEAKISSRTVARLLKGTGETGIWIVDEAGLLSARDCELLMAKARQSHSKIIFVGDTRQLSSVEAGNPFKLMQQHGIETAYMTESRRQKTTLLKKAAEAMAKGEMADGLKELDRSIYEFKREDTRVRHVAAEFLALSPGERLKTLVLAGTNRERGLITEEIRLGLKKEGILSGGINVQSLVPKDLTREEIKAGVKIEVGDILVFHRKDQGFLKGDQRTVLGKKGNELDLEGREQSFELKGQETFTVYRTEEREFSIGDKVRWTRNDKGLRNGEEFWVAKAGQDGLKLINQKDKELMVNGYVFLDHAYVSTVYASQGKTAERVLISTDHTFGKESMYVAVTRAKSEVKIYTEDKGRMVGRAEVTQAKVSARELITKVKSAESRPKIFRGRGA